MRRMQLDDDAIGFPLAMAAVDSSGLTLAAPGTVITAESLNRLRKGGVRIVYVDDPAFSGLFFQAAVSPETLALATEVFDGSRTDLAANPDKALDYKAFARVARSIVRDADELSLDEAMVLYPEHENQRDLVHALNRASLAVRLATVLDLGRYRFDLGLAGLVADIGMWFLSGDLLAKRGQLEPEERAQIEGHVQETLRVLPIGQGWGSVSRVAISQHHERMDGTGYPKQLRGDEIHRTGRLIAACDVYTALTLDRPGRDLFTPAEALEFIIGGADTSFDYDVVTAFHRHVPPYPVGTEVQLSTGERAVVTQVRGLKSRPIIRVFTDAQGKRLDDVYETDLAERTEHSRTIVGVIG
jgi:HD-GYP domain-containing protein (c-di-GMP phosphodiesterase class II)